MCSVGEKIYILGGQLESNTEDDSGTVYILDTSKLGLLLLFYFTLHCSLHGPSH